MPDVPHDDVRDPMRPCECQRARQQVREQVRESVRTLRHGSADGSGELMVRPDDRPRHEMQDNARRCGGEIITQEDDSPVSFEARLKPLTARQQTAINLITMGKTIVATARTLKVDPATIHRWKATNPQFAAELNRRQTAMFDGMVIKLRLTMERAIEELHAVLASPSKRERAEAMWKLLPMLKPQHLITPTAPTTAAGVIDAQIRQARAQRGEVVEAEITNEERLARVRPEDRAEPTSADSRSCRCGAHPQPEASSRRDDREPIDGRRLEVPRHVHVHEDGGDGAIRAGDLVAVEDARGAAEAADALEGRSLACRIAQPAEIGPLAAGTVAADGILDAAERGPSCGRGGGSGSGRSGGNGGAIGLGDGNSGDREQQ